MRPLTIAAVILVALAGDARGDDTHCRPTLAPRASGAQVADETFNPPIRNPGYPEGRGPRVVLDEAHANFHTVEGRYGPFVRLLRRDGFVVEPHREKFTADNLSATRILVIANATAPAKQGGAVHTGKVGLLHRRDRGRESLG